MMFRGNVLKYGGTVISYQGKGLFTYSAYSEDKYHRVYLKESGEFCIHPNSLVLYGGSENHVRYISILEPVFRKLTKIPFEMIDEDQHRVAKVVKLLLNKSLN